MTYRYYMTQRPPSPGAQPKGSTNLVIYDTKTEGAWGYVEYREPLTEKQITDYELEESDSNE